MPRPRSRPGTASATRVRTQLGLSQQQLADWLGVTASFVAACEGGRKVLPPGLLERLLVLTNVMPPPLGTGPPDALALLPAGPTLPALAVPPRPTQTTGLAAPASAPLLAAARTARLAALVAERELLRLHTRAVALAVRRQGLARLQAAPPPAEAARWYGWLASLATDLALADPHPTEDAARRYALAARAATRYAEADMLEAAARP